MELEHTEDGCTGLWYAAFEDPEDTQPTQPNTYIECGGCAAEYQFKEELWQQACRQNRLAAVGVELANEGVTMLRLISET